MDACRHAEWWLHDFALLALPRGEFRSTPSILRCRECGVEKRVDTPPEVIDEVWEAWKRYDPTSPEARGHI